MVVVLETTTTNNAQSYGFAHLRRALLFCHNFMNMQSIKKKTNSGKPQQPHTQSTALSLNNDKMNIEQLNEYLVKRSKVLCEYVRKERIKYQKGGIPHTSDIIPPICHIDMPLHKNIDNALACYSNTLSAALFCESEYIKKFEELEAFGSIINDEKDLFFDFLTKNDLTGKFNEFVIKQRGVVYSEYAALKK